MLFRSAQGHPIQKAVTEEELRAGVLEYLVPEKPAGGGNWASAGSGLLYNTKTGETKPIGKDNPQLPQGVEDYIGSMQRRGYSREQARTELASVWSQLQRDHPNLSALRVEAAVKQLFPDDALGGGGPVVPSAAGRGAGAGRPAGGGEAGGRTATSADVAAVAQKMGVSTADAQRELEARGVRIVH